MRIPDYSKTNIIAYYDHDDPGTLDPTVSSYTQLPLNLGGKLVTVSHAMFYFYNLVVSDDFNSKMGNRYMHVNTFTNKAYRRCSSTISLASLTFGRHRQDLMIPKTALTSVPGCKRTLSISPRTL